MESANSLELVYRCASESASEAWEEFMRRYRPRMAAGVRRALAQVDARLSRGEHEDILQEAFCRLLEGRGRRLLRCRAEGESAVAAYLTRVAERVAFDRLRARSAVKRGSHCLVPVSDPCGPRALAERVVDRQGSPEDRVLERERRLIFFARCRALVPARSAHRDLRIVYLAFFEGMTSREISRRLGRELAPSSIDSLLHRLRRRLAAHGVQMPRRS